MIVLVSHKIRLKPNKAQIIYFEKASEIARFVYNWALSESIDRDLNAAKNIEREGLRLLSLAGSSPVSVCGENSSGTSRKGRTKLSSAKQKINHGLLYEISLV